MQVEAATRIVNELVNEYRHNKDLACVHFGIDKEGYDISFTAAEAERVKVSNELFMALLESLDRIAYEVTCGNADVDAVEEEAMGALNAIVTLASGRETK